MDANILNPADGSIRIDDQFKISCLSTLDEVVGYFGQDRVKVTDHNNGGHSVTVINVNIGDYWFVFTFGFVDGLLRGIEIRLDNKEFIGGWENWSEAEELRRLKLCELWLYQQTGMVKSLFPWGRVNAYYDSRGGFSYIALRYEK